MYVCSLYVGLCSLTAPSTTAPTMSISPSKALEDADDDFMVTV